MFDPISKSFLWHDFSSETYPTSSDEPYLRLLIHPKPTLACPTGIFCFRLQCSALLPQPNCSLPHWSPDLPRSSFYVSSVFFSLPYLCFHFLGTNHLIVKISSTWVHDSSHDSSLLLSASHSPSLPLYVHFLALKL